jgi:hypothetical protein
MSARINGITNTNNDVSIENNIRLLPITIEEYYVSLEKFNNFSKNLGIVENNTSSTINNISGNLVPTNSIVSDLGSSSKLWRNAYIQDISARNISISGNIEPLIINSTSKLGSTANYWSNAYIQTISAIHMSVSEIAGIGQGIPLWVAVGQGNYSIAYSYNGSEWNGTTNSIFTLGQGVAYNGTMWVVVGSGNNNSIAYSYNGIKWDPITSSANIFTSGKGVAYNGTMWVAVGSENNNSIAYSYDGINWHPVPSSTNIFTEGYDVAYNGNLWIAVGSGGHTIAYSYDGSTNWYGIGSSIFTGAGYSIAHNGTMWVAVGTGTNSIAYSYDGSTNWYPVSSASINIFTYGYGVAHNGTMWVALGYGTNNTIAYSPDGINWTGIGNSIFTTFGYGVGYNGTMWVATGLGGNSIAYSYDGSEWFPSSNGSNMFFFGYKVASGYTPGYIPKPLRILSTIIPSNANAYDLGSTTNLWRSAYIQDISASNINVSGNISVSESISVSGNIVPLNNNNNSDLGLSARRWNNLYVRNIDMSGSISNVRDICNVRQIIPRLGGVSDISTSLGTSSNIWQRAFINDLSGINSINGMNWPLSSGGTSDFSGLDINTNLLPRDSSSVDLGNSSKYWRNAYIQTINATNMSISGNIVPFINVSGSLGTIDKIWQKAFIRDLSASNISISGSISIPNNAISYENLSTGVQTQISNLEKRRGIIKIRNDSSLNATLALPYDIYYRDVLSGSTTMFTSGIVYPQTNDSNYYTLPTSSIYNTYITIEFENSEGTTIQNVVLVNATQFSLSANKRILTIVLTNTGYASENITVKVTVETVET